MRESPFCDIGPVMEELEHERRIFMGLRTWSRQKFSTSPLMSDYLMNDEDVDRIVAELKADLDAAGREAKAWLLKEKTRRAARRSP